MRLLLIAAIIFIISCTSKNKKESNASVNKGHYPNASSSNYADSINSGIIPKDTLKGSPIRTTMAMVGNNHVHIVYGSPGVKGRIIWGGLVAYDEVWVTGAHKATSIDFSKDVIIGEKKVAAGKYAFFTIPNQEKWTLILNKNCDQHLADKYSEKEDVLRVDVAPIVQENIIQRLTYTVKSNSDDGGMITMQWEKIEVSLPFTNAY